MIFARGAAILADEVLLQRLQHRQPLLQAFGIFGRIGHVPHFAVVGHDKRRPRHAQKARPDAGPADGDKRRQFQFRNLIGQFMRHHRAITGMLDVRIGHVARVHVVAAAAVVRLAGAHRADHRQLIHLLGQERQVLGNLQAIDAGRNGLELSAGRRAGLQIPNVDGAGPAPHPQQNAALVLLLQIQRAGQDAVGKRDGGAGHDGRPGQMRQKMAARHSRPATAIDHDVSPVNAFARVFIR